MVDYVEAVEEYYADFDETSVFLAGGITNCPDWQKDIVELLSDTNLVLYNPRRADFPIGDPNAAKEQITWEHKYLHKADMILFWFPKETLCPIVLYELGYWTNSSTPIFVGVHPEYQRRQDVEIQTGLSRSNVEGVYSLEDLAQQVKDNLD